MTAVQNNASAWAIFSNASSAVMGKTVAELAGLNPSGYADMNAIASSSTAMAAIATSSTAMSASSASTTAINALKASPLLVAKKSPGIIGLRKRFDLVEVLRFISMAPVLAEVMVGSKRIMFRLRFPLTELTRICSKRFKLRSLYTGIKTVCTLYYIPC